MSGIGTTEILLIFSFLMILVIPLLIIGVVWFTKIFAKNQMSNKKKCPFCAEMIQPEAIVCRFCGRDV